MASSRTLTPSADILVPSPPGRMLSLWRIIRRKPVGAVAGGVCLLLVVLALSADFLAPHAPEGVNHPRLQGPSLDYPFGTDNLFRDMFSRTIVGSQISIGIGFSSVAVGTVLGMSFGIVSGYLGGWVDLVSQRVMDIILGFPPLVAAIFFLTVFGTTFLTVTVAIGVIIAPTTARIVRGATLSVRQQQYIEAAESMGNGSLRIMVRHVLPNVFAPIIVVASIQIGNAILAEAALSFLGLSIARDDQPSWGTMLNETRAVWPIAWWTSIVPGIAISIAVLSFNLFGDALRDVLDPRLRQPS